MLILAGCGQSVQPFSTSFGVIQPGSTIVVRALHGDINVYKPEIGKPRNEFIIQATGSKGGAALVPPRMRSREKTLFVSSGADVNALLVRVPSSVALDASSSAGDVNVTDITGPVVAHADRGEVKVMVPGYAQASTGPASGNVTVYMGSTNWPGTLHFSARQGDVEVWINATADFHAHMHSDQGTIFTDFGLRGTSQGQSETIDGQVSNTTSDDSAAGTPKDGAHGIDIEVHNGSIRLLQLKPQM